MLSNPYSCERMCLCHTAVFSHVLILAGLLVFLCCCLLLWCSTTTTTPPGHRLKIHVAKEGVTIAMAPSGVRAPQRAMPAMGGRPATAGEPYGEEAYLWTREHFNQRDVSGVVRGRVGVAPF